MDTLGKVFIAGVQILGKAFVEASKQAAKNAKNSNAKLSLDSKTGMTIEEACQILNIKGNVLDFVQISK
ncbi:4316_t:CDS:2 [Acaulospora colombiana]|uniref:4316_t:CDS:1 n=1 Tax=Acaulospora colombiana TaxID=27376 RepID=A0ACA9L7W3_9GLOM|nr:4316_t:CDS:2 [Acaulospora colombiana]